MAGREVIRASGFLRETKKTLAAFFLNETTDSKGTDSWTKTTIFTHTIIMRTITGDRLKVRHKIEGFERECLHGQENIIRSDNMRVQAHSSDDDDLT